ncbi:(2Fe-2S)-binding protein [Streptacidiphilus cavernicola]|uniref:(2Fe-2S)-binding protein n=1 Tax=Streptacidiphilus cavernicola TaxID=3342716 RepID=A0ABV6VXP2_9ACTN
MDGTGEMAGDATGDREALVAVVERVAALGPFFGFGTHPDGARPALPWRPMAELAEDPAVLRERAEAVRGYLAAGAGRRPEALELRVGASVAQLGLAARLLSPAVGFAALHGGALVAGLDELWWQPVLGGGFPLSLPERAVADALRGADQGPALVGAALGAGLLEGPVRAVLEAAAGLSVSRRVLWGNVASAVNGAAAALAATAPGPVAARGRALAGVLLRQPALRDAALSGPGGFRRRSCCLIYRAAGDPAGPASLCGDCVLAGRPAAR